MHDPLPRTLLEQLFRRSRHTIEEHCVAFEKTARRHGEKVSLCPRQLSRWMAGMVKLARPVAQRVALLHWGYEFEELVGPPLPEAALEPGVAVPSPDWPAWFGVQVGQIIGAASRGASPDALQAVVDRDILMFDIAKDNRDQAYTLSRRQALITLAALPLTASPFLSSVPSSASAAESLSAAAAAEQFLSQCATSLTACWHLLRGNDFQAVGRMVSSYLMALEGLAKQRSARQKAAAGLASQAHRVNALVALHAGQLSACEYHRKQAVFFADVTEQPNQRALALVSLSCAYVWYGRTSMPTALTFGEQALSLESEISPLLRAKAHAVLAGIYGQLGREREALAAIDSATVLYPSDPEQDPDYLQAESTPAGLAVKRGLAYLALAEHLPRRSYETKAVEIFDKMSAGSGPDRIRVEGLNRQAEAAVLLGDLDAFDVHFAQTVDGVQHLGSMQRQREMRETWTRALTRWPHEQRLKPVGERVRAAITA
jgi:tetratricopeptide (TPR) repeat protein